MYCHLFQNFSSLCAYISGGNKRLLYRYVKPVFYKPEQTNWQCPDTRGRLVTKERRKRVRIHYVSITRVYWLASCSLTQFGTLAFISLFGLLYGLTLAFTDSRLLSWTCPCVWLRSRLIFKSICTLSIGLVHFRLAFACFHLDLRSLPRTHSKRRTCVFLSLGSDKWGRRESMG